MTVLKLSPARPELSGDAATGWNRVVLAKLTEWEQSPSPADADFDSPTAASLAAAHTCATALRDAGEPPPTRVGPDGSGGVVFETLDGSAIVRRIEVSDAGHADLYEFSADGRTMRHTPLGR